MANTKLITGARSTGCGHAVAAAHCKLFAGAFIVNFGVIGKQHGALGQVMNITHGPLRSVVGNASCLQLGRGNSDLPSADVVLHTEHFCLGFGGTNFVHIGQEHQFGIAHLVVDGKVGLLIVVGNFGCRGVLGGA